MVRVSTTAGMGEVGVAAESFGDEGDEAEFEISAQAKWPEEERAGPLEGGQDGFRGREIHTGGLSWGMAILPQWGLGDSLF